jgi:hypothetical protein
MSSTSTPSRCVYTKIGFVYSGDYIGAQVGIGYTNLSHVLMCISCRQQCCLVFSTHSRDIYFDNKVIQSFSVLSFNPSNTLYEILFKDGSKATIQVDSHYIETVNSILTGSSLA